MHYCALLVTNELPNDNKIAEIMDKYNSENLEYDEKSDKLIGEYPVFTWDWYQIGGRYAGSLKLKVDMGDDKYRWGFYSREPREGKLFHSYILREMKRFANNSFMYSEEKYFSSMGFQDDFLYVDGALSDDLLNLETLDCYICIDSDGLAIARESWNGTTFVKDINYDEKFHKILNSCTGKYITVLDIHD